MKEHPARPHSCSSVARELFRVIGCLGVAVLTSAASASAVTIPPGSAASFTATAYCDRGPTRSGVPAQRGIAAADPAVLPVGSVVRVASGQPAHEGIYTVMDTGGKVIGRRIDIYIGNCREARSFGLKRVVVWVLRLGWNPIASEPPSADASVLRPVQVALSDSPDWDGVADDLSDGAITAKVKSRLALDDTIRSRDIHVATKDAVVTLTGQVASDAEREKAVKIARETEGVKSVTDSLQVKK